MAMYKYNSWTLPGLPANWNQVTHRYAVVLRSRESGAVECFQLLVSSLPFVVKVVNGTQVIAFPCEASVYNSFWFTENEQWWDLSEVELEHAENCQFHYVAASTNDSGLSYDWAWCNESIRDDSNNVVYPGSVPVLIEEPEPEPEPEAYDRQNFLNGLAAVLCSKARAFPKRGPVAFLYGHVAKEGETPTHTINGVGYVGAVLPKLPERDMSAFPYLVVVGYNFLRDNTPTDFFVLASAEPAYLNEGETIAGGYRTDIEVKKPWMKLNGDSEDFQWYGHVGDNWVKTYGAWTPDRGISQTYSRLMLDGKVEARIVWANHNVLNEDGSVFFAACPDPTPAYINTMKYLYNGAAAHPLPTETGNGGFAWNKEKYPYAVLYSFEYSHAVYLLVFSVKPTADTNEDSLSFPTEALYMNYSQVFPGYWYTVGLEYKLSAGVNKDAYLDIPHWANFDIVDENGNVVLAASEPIPVYE